MKKILVIEDDPVMGAVCQRLLSKHGFAVEIANDGVKGLEKLPEFQPDAVLLDMMMPKKNGLDVLKDIRAQERYRTLPVIVFTNACVPALIEQAMLAGASHTLDKARFNPVAVIELLRGVTNAGPGTAVDALSHSERISRLH